MEQFDLAILVLRVVTGLFFVAHGYNKVAQGLAGTAAWFGSVGMRAPMWQARAAAGTEIGAGLLLAAGLLTPLAAAGIIGVMVVAIRVAHWKAGFFIFTSPQGWEYCASIIAAAFVIGMAGPGRWSVDHGLDLMAWYEGWTGAVVAGGVGVLGGIGQLLVSYRPTKASS
ncbi:MAG: hypothetical protein RI958_557 [Actinomycetota bacterium]